MSTDPKKIIIKDNANGKPPLSRDKGNEKAKNGKGQKNELIDAVIHVMPQFNKGKDKNKRLARKLGLAIITISIICLIFFVFFAYSYLYKNKAAEEKKNTNLIEEIDDQELKVPDKIIKKVIEKEEIEEEIEEPPLAPKTSIELNEIEEDMQGTSTTSTTSIELIEDLEQETDATESATTSTSTKESPETIDYKLIDSDNDGLSDKEEIVLGTDKNSNDSDGDGFLDLEEVLTLNNPIGEGVMEKNSNMKKYVNNELNYSLFYPATWSYSSLSGEGSIKFQAIDKQTIQIIIPANTDRLNIEEWYSTEVSAKRIKQEQRISKNNWNGLKSENNLNAYIIHPELANRVFVIFYTPGVNYVLEYKNIFEMMINSFKIGEADSEEDEEITEDAEEDLEKELVLEEDELGFEEDEIDF